MQVTKTLFLPFLLEAAVVPYLLEDVEVLGVDAPGQDRVLTPDALAFVARLHREFNEERVRLLEKRSERDGRLSEGRVLVFPEETRYLREGKWSVASAPPDLWDRRVEIGVPANRIELLDLLRSEACVVIADFEDTLSPTWNNIISGQKLCQEAVMLGLSYAAEPAKRSCTPPALIMKPRGWHLEDKHVLVDGEQVSASLLDFGLYFFHNAADLLEQGSGPYFYLPKLESYEEARLWNDVFIRAQEWREIPRGSIRATALIETLPAAFEMDEILYELREHASGLAAGWTDYIFSTVKFLCQEDECLLPERGQIKAKAPFLRAYEQKLVQVCHRRDATVIGGMSAWEIDAPDAGGDRIVALREAKREEVEMGFDGTRVNHPSLIPVAKEIFNEAFGAVSNQKHITHEDVQIEALELRDVYVPRGSVSREGLERDIEHAMRYIESWLRGEGLLERTNRKGGEVRVEDVATAEIARSLLWQWLYHGVELKDGTELNDVLYVQIRESITERLHDEHPSGSRFLDAADVLDHLVLADYFIPFLTIPAYDWLDEGIPVQNIPS